MHNTIYQIITFPVTSDEYLSESDFRENSFVGDIANYVSGNTNRDEEIKYLCESFVKNHIAVFSDDNSFRILSDGKTNYFKTAFERCIETIKLASEMTLEEFADAKKSFTLILDINNSYCNKFSDYVYSDVFGTIPLDEFIRKSIPGVQYYIGGILKYHR